MANRLPPKKGPHRMATACKPQTPEQLNEQELDAQIEAHALRAHRIIQKARAKMTPEEHTRELMKLAMSKPMEMAASR